MSKGTGMLVVYGGAALFSLFTAVAHVAPILDDPKGTEDVLKAQGFEPIDVGGGVWFGGSEGDFWRTKFTAQNASGICFKGYTTSGVLKGTTIRDSQVIPCPVGFE